MATVLQIPDALDQHDTAQSIGQENRGRPLHFSRLDPSHFGVDA
jgi:hypothetical protein